MLIAALGTSVLAMALTFLASSHQRLLRAPLPAFPTRVSAVLAAIVALKAWTEALKAGEGMFVVLTILLLVAVLSPYSVAFRRARR